MLDTRVKLMLDYPFFGILALSLPLVPQDTVRTAATDGQFIFYNKQYIAKLTPKQRLFVYLHEIGHVILLHMFREDGKDHDLWNVACDHAVNLLLKDSIKINMPPNVLCNPIYKGMSAEEIYKIICKQKNHSDIKNQINLSKEHGEVLPAPKDLEKHEVAATIVSAAATNNISGDLKIDDSTDLGRQIEKIISKKVPWQSILQRFLTESCQSDYSWMKPNLKYRKVSGGFILPSLNTEKELKIAVVFDVSGSVDKKKCANFFSNFLGMIDAIDFKELHVLSCSDRIFNPQVFQKGDKIEYEPSGTGGTEAWPVWKYFEQENIIPNCVVYFTDLVIFEFGKNPTYPVIWTVDPAGMEDFDFTAWENRVPFGEVIYID
jgi:predicted metal-dependent peptidase